MDKRILSSYTMQDNETDSGVACLASIIRYHKGYVSKEKLREASGASLRGATLLGLNQAASIYGLDAKAFIFKSIDHLSDLTSPAILYTGTNKGISPYVVFYGFDKDRLIIGDPSSAILLYSKEEMEKIWPIKIVLKMTPTSELVKEDVVQAHKRKLIGRLIKREVSTLIVVLCMGVMTALLGLSISLFIQRLIDNYLFYGDGTKLIVLLIFVFVLLIVRTILTYAIGSLVNVRSYAISKRIIDQFYHTLLQQPQYFFYKRKTGDLLTRMNETTKIQVTLSALLSTVVIDLLVFVASMASVFFYSWIIGLFMLSMMPVYVLIASKFSSPIRSSQREVQESKSSSQANAIDAIQSITTIKVHSRESFFEKLNQFFHSNIRNNIFQLGELNTRFSFFLDIINALLLMVTFGLAVFMVSKKEMSIGEVVGILTLVLSLIPSISRIALMNIQIQEARVVVDRMFELNTTISQADQDIRHVAISFSSLAVNTLSFGFPGSTVFLKDINFEIRKGEWVSILGKSGGGKTTIIQLLLKLYSPRASSSLIINGNKNWNDISISDWRKLIGAVPQEIKLFSGTVLFNITLSYSTEDAQEAIAMFSKLGFNKYFERLPQDLMTKVGEDGIRLPGGYKQMIAIARALFRKTQVLLLDEPTSAMDADAEEFVFNLFEKLKNDMTIVLFTNRVRLARRADRMYILRDGKISPPQ